MFIVYFLIKYHTYICNASLVMALKSKAKENSKAAMLFYILQNTTLTNAERFRTISYHISYQDPKLCGSSVTFTSQVCASVIFFINNSRKL
jgi:hypothetical protein